MHFSAADLLIPFASPWRTGAVALGVVAMWLLVAVEATSLAMKRIPRRYWRWIHLSSYAVFLLTSLHAAFAGTDSTHWLYQGTAVATIIAVVVANDLPAHSTADTGRHRPTQRIGPRSAMSEAATGDVPIQVHSLDRFAVGSGVRPG